MTKTLQFSAITLLFLACVLRIGYFLEQSDFYHLLMAYSPFFVLYVWIAKRVTKEKEIYFFVIVGIALRFALLFGLPTLSDDVYRFIWDGRLLNNGYNPFDHLPAYYLENLSIQGIDQSLFDQLNSPEYFTIYPPIAQCVFAVAVWIFPNSILGSAIIMKIILFIFEIGSILLIIKILRQLALPLKNVLWYALNPLIILEITGNLHFEGVMIFFVLLSYYLLLQKKITLSGITMACAVAAKLLPLLFLPFLLFQLKKRNLLIFFGVLAASLIIFFFPLINGVFITHFGESLNLYFQRFEFNGSIYYCLRWLGYQWKGYNLISIIGPILGITVFLGIFYKAFLSKKEANNLPVLWLFAICLYLACATTVHPWYVSLPLVLCLFTNYRFPILWSGLIFLTYINYSYDIYFENIWVVAVEYLIVFLYAGWEVSKLRIRNYELQNR